MGLGCAGALKRGPAKNGQLAQRDHDDEPGANAAARSPAERRASGQEMRNLTFATRQLTVCRPSTLAQSTGSRIRARPARSGSFDASLRQPFLLNARRVPAHPCTPHRLRVRTSRWRTRCRRTLRRTRRSARRCSRSCRTCGPQVHPLYARRRSVFRAWREHFTRRPSSCCRADHARTSSLARSVARSHLARRQRRARPDSRRTVRSPPRRARRSRGRAARPPRRSRGRAARPARRFAPEL
jgi:hypothetical protein